MSKALDTLLKKARAALKKKEPPEGDPVRQIVLAVLSANAPRDRAENALEKLCRAYADINELRVSLPDELVEVIGVSYPQGLERLTRLSEALHEVFNREHQMEITSLKSKGKREQMEYLATLPGLTHSMAAQVFALSYEGHAMPVDERLLALLREEGAVEEDCDARHAENLLLKAIKSGEAVMHLLALWQYVDSHPPKSWPPKAAPKPPLVATPASAAKKGAEAARKPEAKVEPKQDAKPAAKPEQKPAPKAEAKPAAKAAPKPARKLEPSQKPGVRPAAAAKPKPKPAKKK